MGSLDNMSRHDGDVTNPSLPEIIDIRSDSAGIELRKEILTGLNSTSGEGKTLPTLLLYDDQGLKLFEDITYLDQYYLTDKEIEVLERNADRIASCISAGTNVIELGSGNLRKIKILLDALDRAEKKVFYYALDLMQSELERTLAAIPTGTFNHVECRGLLGTYDDGLEWLKQPVNVAKPKAILSMGSSVGNFPRHEAAAFISQFASILGPKDMLLFGIDACNDAEKVYNAYNDRANVTHDFTMNGLKHANRLLGYDAFSTEDWEAVGEFVHDRLGSRHQAFVVPKKEVIVEGVLIREGEKVRIEQSYKYSPKQADILWREAGVVETSFWTNDDGLYVLHLLTPPTMEFSSKPHQYAKNPVPNLDEWHELWKTWDLVTRHMIPHDELFEKPIKLRNACIFYLGHIPTFADIKLSEATKGRPTEPSYFYKIFERGIDPDVDNPEKVHAHSEIPDAWPALDEILTFQDRVRERVTNLYKSGQAYNDQWIARTLWLGFEHEIMHLETLLYMLVQSDKVLPPNGTVRPDFQQLAAQADRLAVDNEWFEIPAQTVHIGLDDPDNADGPIRYFGWDVEKPAYTTEVKAFKVQGRPITNGEYAEYLLQTKQDKLPASWTKDASYQSMNSSQNGYTNRDAAPHDFYRGKAVRTVYGSVPLEFALHWPVAASYDELVGCANFMGGRIPTLEEARSLYKYADAQTKQSISKTHLEKIPAVNGHLVNNGVQESPPAANEESNGVADLNPLHLFRDLEEANVGFKHWHPMPVTQNGNKLCGLAEMGGLWEWTSSPLKKLDGFEPMKLYPAYSADFYDGKHNIVLGGSWATHPRVAGRNTFVNWYQRNYPYVWAGARLVKDI